MAHDSKVEWLSVFQVWLTARFNAEFEDADWAPSFNDAVGRVIAAPRGRTEPRIVVSLPPDALSRPPYVIAAQVAAEIRSQAEQAGSVPRRRTTPIEPIRKVEPPPQAEPPVSEA